MLCFTVYEILNSALFLPEWTSVIELFVTAAKSYCCIYYRFGSTKIFVGNIRDGTTSDQLRELFECYGRVAECDVLTGFGFVVSSSYCSLFIVLFPLH